jgi:hypothetical protein
MALIDIKKNRNKDSFFDDKKNRFSFFWSMTGTVFMNNPDQ